MSTMYEMFLFRIHVCQAQKGSLGLETDEVLSYNHSPLQIGDEKDSVSFQAEFTFWAMR